MSRLSGTLLWAAVILAAAPVRADSSHAAHTGAANDLAMEAHMRMTAPRAVTPADEARYQALEASIRRDLARYQDIAVATADGYEQFLPGVEQDEYHFTRRANAIAAAFTFDPLKPTSLLYGREPAGRFRLTGVMYTAPAFYAEAELDKRVPLAIARWHQHVNLCVPGPLHRERWAETLDGQPVFGPRSPIATEEACDEVGGRFVPRLFGWMVHVNAFDPDPG